MFSVLRRIEALFCNQVIKVSIEGRVFVNVDNEFSKRKLSADFQLLWIFFSNFLWIFKDLSFSSVLSFLLFCEFADERIL